MTDLGDVVSENETRPTTGWLHYSQHGECIADCSGCALERVEVLGHEWSALAVSEDNVRHHKAADARSRMARDHADALRAALRPDGSS